MEGLFVFHFPPAGLLGSVTATPTFRTIRVPDDCPASPPPQYTIQRMTGDSFFLLPGFQFNDKACCPNITSILAIGRGILKLELLQLRMKTSGRYKLKILTRGKVRISQLSNTSDLEFKPPITLQCEGVNIGVAVYCTSQDCEFNTTNHTVARSGMRVWDNGDYVEFFNSSHDHQPVAALTFSCKYIT